MMRGAGQLLRFHGMQMLFGLLVGFWPAVAPAHQMEKNHRIKRLEFKGTKIVDAAHLITKFSGLNVIATTEAGQKEVTLYLENVNTIDAIEAMVKVGGLAYREDPHTGTIHIMTAKHYNLGGSFNHQDITKVFTLKHPNTQSIALAIRDLYGPRVILSRQAPRGALPKQNQRAPRKGPRSPTAYGPPFSIPSPWFRPQFGETARDHGRGSQTAGGRFDPPRARNENIYVVEPVGPSRPSTAHQRQPAIYVTTNRPHNLVIVRSGDAAALRAIERLVGQMDRPVGQVLLKMTLMRIALDEKLGSIFNLDPFNRDPFNRDPVAGASKGLPGDAPMPGTATGNHPPGSDPSARVNAAMDYRRLNQRLIERIDLLQKQHRVRLLATSIVLASSERPAEIFVGQKQIASGSAGPSPEPGALREFAGASPNIGATLKIVPKINADRTILLLIDQETSTLKPGSGALAVDTATFSGSIVTTQNTTVAVGGLIERSTRRVKQSSSWASHLPGMGNMFSKEVQQPFQTELVLLITPSIYQMPAADRFARRRQHELSTHPYHNRIHSKRSGSSFDSPQAVRSSPPPPKLQENPRIPELRDQYLAPLSLDSIKTGSGR